MIWRQIHRWLGLVAGSVAVVLGLTGMATLASLVNLCMNLPVFLVTPWAGRLADRAHRREHRRVAAGAPGHDLDLAAERGRPEFLDRHFRGFNRTRAGIVSRVCKSARKHPDAPGNCPFQRVDRKRCRFA